MRRPKELHMNYEPPPVFQLHNTSNAYSFWITSTGVAILRNWLTKPPWPCAPVVRQPWHGQAVCCDALMSRRIELRFEAADMMVEGGGEERNERSHDIYSSSSVPSRCVQFKRLPVGSVSKRKSGPLHQTLKLPRCRDVTNDRHTASQGRL